MTRILKMRPAKRTQSKRQRLSWKTNPISGTPWGQVGWPSGTTNVLDITVAVFGVRPAPFATLAALEADATFGDGALTYNAGANFTAGQFVLLQDDSIAHYNTAAWVVGAAPA